jgi:branched-chain amino acid transport system substrate-binding protein
LGYQSADVLKMKGGGLRILVLVSFQFLKKGGDIDMKKIIIILSCVFISLFSAEAFSKEDLKIGYLFDLTGPFAPAGSLGGYRGSIVASDMINDQGGILGKYKIVPIVSDSQSSPDVALREAERLITVEKVPVILGVYSSAIAVPLAPICEKNKTIFWVIIAISDAVVKGRNQQYVFRVQPMGSQWGQSTVDFINEEYGRLKYRSPKEIKGAVIYEDGPYGVSVSTANLERVEKYGMKLVMKESYSHKAKDLSSLVLKLKAADPDVIFHTGYFPDIVILLRQARELGLKTKAIIGHGAGYANFPLLEESLGREIMNYVYNVDPAPAQILDPKKLKPGLGGLNKEFLKRYNEKFKDPNPPTHATQGFAHSWVLLNEVIPLAVKKYGTPTADHIRKAALEIDIPEGATPAGYGVKFATPDQLFAGQDLRSYPVVMQWMNGKIEIVWPKAMKTTDPKLPMPPDSVFAK